MRNLSSRIGLGPWLLVFAWLTSAPAAALEADRYMLVLDLSNSMWAQIEGRAKIELAREVMGDLVSDWPAEVETGLVAYGHRDKTCTDIETLIPASPVDAEAFKARIGSLKPRGRTPLTAALQHAAEALDYQNRPATLILFSDGVESCDQDPCAMATELEAANPMLTAHVVGFSLGAEQSQSQLACIAENTGGRFFSAADQGELYKVAQEIFAETLGQAVEAERLRAGVARAIAKRGAQFEAALAAGDLDQAQTELDALGQLVGDDPEARENYERFAERLEARKQARREQLAVEPLLRDAEAATADGRFADALRIYQEVLSRLNDDPAALSGLNDLAVALGRALSASLATGDLPLAEQQLTSFAAVTAALGRETSEVEAFRAQLQALRVAEARTQAARKLVRQARRQEQAGQPRPAFAAYRDALALNADNAEAAAAVQRFIASSRATLELAIGVGEYEQAQAELERFSFYAQALPDGAKPIADYQARIDQLRARP